MTNFKLDRSYIGVAYETIANHKWERNFQQYGYSADVAKDNIRKWINDIVVATKGYDDRRNMQIYWSPDGDVKIPIENVERGFDLHEHSWSDGSPSQGGYVALIGDVVGGISVYGPFSDGEAASDWAREDDNTWTVATLDAPT